MKISILEYLYNLISIICLIDLIYCNYLINKDKFIIKQYGLDKLSKIKLLCEKIIIIIYVLYIIYKIVTLIIN